MKKVVKSIGMLRTMSSLGIIKLHPHTGNVVQWWGRDVRAWYVDDCGKLGSHFTYRHRQFCVEYVDGCFYPFVFEIK